MITDNPVLHEQQHQLLTLIPQYTANRPTDGVRAGERRLDPTTGIEWFWTGSAWQQVAPTFPADNVGVGLWANRPASPSAYQLYFAVDRQILYFWYTGTSRWLTVQSFEIPIYSGTAWAVPRTITTNVAEGVGPLVGKVGISTSHELQIWYSETVCSTAATFDATHFWTQNIGVAPASGAGTEILSIPLRTASQTTAGTIYTFGGGGNGVIYNDSTGVYLYNVFRNNVNGSVSAGTLSVYKTTVWVKIAG